MKFTVGMKVRVWWGPTSDEEKTGYGGAYWPAVVQKVVGQKQLEVTYDNGDIEVVDLYDVFRGDVPVDFGQEEHSLQPGEFCEVFNQSDTDPCAWFGKIDNQMDRKSYIKYRIAYPFHDQDSEVVKAERVRRARIYDEDCGTWKVVRPLQEWRAGCLCSPGELELVTEDEVFRVLSEGKVLRVGERLDTTTTTMAKPQPESEIPIVKVPFIQELQKQRNEKQSRGIKRKSYEQPQPNVRDYWLEPTESGQRQVYIAYGEDRVRCGVVNQGERPLLVQSINKETGEAHVVHLKNEINKNNNARKESL
eukprot:TRINITY_DN1015_c0_g2_i1.p2 TRINITY_DN1015_c0_g2~~TRINITY_DN1015_c0_g2_i1.p2  ORF type:complete len:306 (+),score=40.41 TRINITY_DN1015_c0_g2_i1:101-1018(+)